MESRRPLQLLALNHVSRVCSDLAASYKFYTEVLGFTPVKRPSSFEFEGAWLHNYGVGLHLIKGCPPPRSKTINPKSCHISFQAASLSEVEDSLVRLGIPYVQNLFLEDGVQVRQLFFHDPDDNMIEVCNCDVLPIVPLESGLAGAIGVGAGVGHGLPAWPAVQQQHTEQLPAAPVGRYAAAPAGSDAGSDDSSHGIFESTSSLRSGSEPEFAEAVVAAGMVVARAVGLGLGAAGPGIGEGGGYDSFSSPMSGVMMADPLGLSGMSITSGRSDLGDWASRVAAAAGASGSSTSSSGCAPDGFLLELSRQRT